ncbi:MAG: pyrroline-5-carboxylate reductase, partial [bacterium]
MTRSTILHGAPIAFIGAGAMGEAMIGGLLRHKLVEPEAITAADLHPARLDEVKRLFGVRTTADNRAAVRKARIVVLSVKPQVLSTVCADLSSVLRPSTLVVSIVAGARISSMAAGLNHEAIVRTMPNTPAQIGEGMTVWTATDAVSEKQREQAGAILGALGKQLFVRDESFLDKATAVSGSGPAYVFMLMEALIDAAVHLGWSRNDAKDMVIQTVRGSAMFAERSPVHPAEMRNMVTSPGGTTADAIYQLDKGGFRTVLSKA